MVSTEALFLPLKSGFALSVRYWFSTYSSRRYAPFERVSALSSGIEVNSKPLFQKVAIGESWATSPFTMASRRASLAF
ncbi:hypothetical protein D3C74_309280 [compost metagenome]